MNVLNILISKCEDKIVWTEWLKVSPEFKLFLIFLVHVIPICKCRSQEFELVHFFQRTYAAYCWSDTKIYFVLLLESKLQANILFGEGHLYKQRIQNESLLNLRDYFIEILSIYSLIFASIFLRNSFTAREVVHVSMSLKQDSTQKIWLTVWLVKKKVTYMLVNQWNCVFFKLTDSTVVIFQLRDKDLPQFFTKTKGYSALPTIWS
jgi:hypothetical protein